MLLKHEQLLYLPRVIATLELPTKRLRAHEFRAAVNPANPLVIARMIVE